MSHAPTKNWQWPDPSAQDASDLVCMRASVALAQEAIGKGDYEVAQYHENAGHMLLVNRAADGRDVRELAKVLLVLCLTEYPRHFA